MPSNIYRSIGLAIALASKCAAHCYIQGFICSKYIGIVEKVLTVARKMYRLRTHDVIRLKNQCITPKPYK